MLIAARNAMLSGRRLPYDAEVAYLENVVGAYINTGFVPSSSIIDVALSIFIPNAAKQVPDYDALFGSEARDNYSMVCLAKQLTYPLVFWRAGSTSNLGTTQPPMETFIDATLSLGANDSFTRSVGKSTNSGTYTNSIGSAINGMCVFAVSTNSSILMPGTGGYRIGYVLIKEDGSPVFDAIPVRVGSGANAVGYLYDRISGQLFGNAGTGAFVIGPDI